MRARLPLRLVRAAAFSAVCVTLAVLGHVAAGGPGPAPWAMAAGGSAVMAAAVLLAGRERSASTISVGLSALQLSLHELFALGDVTGVPSWHPHGRGLGEGLGMLVAHLTATLITGWWLARGETVLWALLRSAHRRLGALFRLAASLLLRPAAGAGIPPHRVTPRAVPRPGRTVLRHSVSRRGPPLPVG
ncbi:MFS transporter [Streptosporangium sp. NPDC050855]|uniref:MFS transporter n=1 Tax=Streptosporangium sp. NPDC050855 TaxID=3366194 RepID=UPI00379D1285